MAEKEYIEKNDLKKIIKANAWSNPAVPNAVNVIIDRTPAADVVEVRHGAWKKVYDKAPQYVCTNCNHLFNNKGYKYCPNCGAKMDGERKKQK